MIVYPVWSDPGNIFEIYTLAKPPTEYNSCRLLAVTHILKTFLSDCADERNLKQWPLFRRAQINDMLLLFIKLVIFPSINYGKFIGVVELVAMSTFLPHKLKLRFKYILDLKIVQFNYHFVLLPNPPPKKGLLYTDSWPEYNIYKLKTFSRKISFKIFFY